GVKVYDGADLGNWLEKYLGGDGPIWAPSYVKHGDKDVLVIVVEAPQWGDSLHTLRQGYDKAILGTIYYRSGSVSRQANPDEIRLLENRLVRGHQAPEINGLEVGYKFVGREDRPGTPLLVFDPTPEQVDEWIERRRAAIHAQHQAVIDQIKPPPPENLLANIFLQRPSIDDEPIERHLEACRQDLFDASRRAMIEHGHGLLQVTAHNPGRRTLEHVQLTLTLATPYSAFDDGNVPKGLKGLPKAPELPEQRNTNPFGFSGGNRLTAFTMPTTPRLANPNVYIPHRIEIKDDSITLDVGQIRPENFASSTQFHLFLHERPVNDRVTIVWTLTSTSTDGVQRGTLDIPVHPMRSVFLRPSTGLPDVLDDA
ncbi:MAG: hypothetical protein ACRYG2_02835, partial [Janthinobacterium lividum]